MLSIDNKATLTEKINHIKQEGKSVALVPTMGNLHEGHLQLIDIAKKHADFVVCSIFVNPTQFGENEDFDTYPRTLEDDKKKLSERYCDLLFLPGLGEMYPRGNNKESLSFVTVPSLSQKLCGKSRPVFFDGVATIVTKLFNLVMPDVAIFGEKDFQQLTVIKAIVEDLNFPVKIVSAPTARETNGLALSSRNNYLSAEEKNQASVIYKTLNNTKESIIQGDTDFSQLCVLAKQQLKKHGFTVDYYEIYNSKTLQSAKPKDQNLVVLTGGWLGKVRLIDNIQFDIG